MNSHTENNLVLSVWLGQNKQWHVSARDFSLPLASFDNPQVACAWAIAVARAKHAKVLIEEPRVSSSGLSRSAMNSSESFKFSIPVTWN